MRRLKETVAVRWAPWVGWRSEVRGVFCQGGVCGAQEGVGRAWRDIGVVAMEVLCWAEKRFVVGRRGWVCWRFGGDGGLVRGGEEFHGGVARARR